MAVGPLSARDLRILWAVWVRVLAYLIPLVGKSEHIMLLETVTHGIRALARSFSDEARLMLFGDIRVKGFILHEPIAVVSACYKDSIRIRSARSKCVPQRSMLNGIRVRM